jgi:hypothetical protein
MKAFPRNFSECGTASEGMDLRDYFAAAALQGILACNYSIEKEPAVLAYEYADAMMKVRNV